MANETKGCNLTEAEIKTLIHNIGGDLFQGDYDTKIERLSYLNKRLKAFKEPETETETKPTPAVAGWGAPTT